MRIVLDMQGAQSLSRYRGIGRYTTSFSRAVVRNRAQHEIILALSGLFPDTIEPIRAAFDDLLPQEHIRVWHAPQPVADCNPANSDRREVAELLRESFLASLRPDIIHISSLFEGCNDEAVTSIRRFDSATPVSVMLYDLIPLLNAEHYLKPNPSYARYYLGKIQYLREASLYLAISDFSREEGIRALGVEPNQVVTISTAIDPQFQPKAINDASADRLRQKFGIRRRFVLYTGGSDERKNLSRLISAYVSLSPSLRSFHQLLLAGKMPSADTGSLAQFAADAGLAPGELLFAGHVTDDELVRLYNLCTLYVFPSWHEGFGLPVLEAMACGAPVIAANTTSLPEVVELDEALFDPFAVESIAGKLTQALVDERFRARLCEHGLRQARRFSWDETARRALSAWETLASTRAPGGSTIASASAPGNLLNAVAFHADKDRSGLIRIADCIARNENAGVERQLLVDVSELCQRDAATGVQRVVRNYLKWMLQRPPVGFRVEPVYADPKRGYRYARAFARRFFASDGSVPSDEPMRWQRGDIFFGLDMQHHVQLAHAAFFRQIRREGVTVKFLVYDLLPIQLAQLFNDPHARSLHEQWLRLIASTDQAICISRATADAFNGWMEDNAITRAATFRTSWVHIGADISGSQEANALSDDAELVLVQLRDRPTFLCVSTIEPRKQQQQILEAIELLWHEGKDINLVFVGQQGWKMEVLAERLRHHAEIGRRLFWLEGISDAYLSEVYSASTCLIAASLNEGFGLSLIEAAHHGIPIIARDIAVFREVAGDFAFFFSGELASDLAAALRDWLGLFEAGGHPGSAEMPWATWEQSTEKLKAEVIEHNYPRRQLFVDISELIQKDAGTGIQRVVHNILQEWLAHPPEGYRVEPVYATVESGYRYAGGFARRLMPSCDEDSPDEPIDYGPGDVFIGLDFQPQVQFARRNDYQELRRQGVRVQFVVYDLLSVLLPQYFPPGSADGFRSWLEVVAEGDGAVCISKAVADELDGWLKPRLRVGRRPFKIEWFHLGADVDPVGACRGISDDSDEVLVRIGARPTFLMVGTVEPRKRHDQVLDAFDELWRDGQDLNLVIVGKQGWMVDDFADRLRSHPRLGEHLFWLQGASDCQLDSIYAEATA
jgi:glycosyltransferase involved in cell wall biosynthesis